MFSVLIIIPIFAVVQAHFTVQPSCQSHSSTTLQYLLLPLIAGDWWSPLPHHTHTHPPSREMTDSNIVTIKHSPLSAPPLPSPTLAGCHLIDLWPLRQQGECAVRDVISVVFVCAAAAGGWWSWCVCVLVQWRESTRIRSNTNSLHAPGFFYFFSWLRVFSQQSIEERWSSQLGGSRTKTLIFGHFRAFRTTAFTFPLSDTLQKHSLAGVEFLQSFFFAFTCKRWSQTVQQSHGQR